MFYVSAKVIPETASVFDTEPQIRAWKVQATDGDAALSFVRRALKEAGLKAVKWIRCAPFDEAKFKQSLN